MQQQRGNGVGNRRTDAAQHAVSNDRGPGDLQHATEGRCVSGLDFDEQDIRVRRKIVRVARLAELVLYSSARPESGRLAMMRTGKSAASLRKPEACSSVFTECTRNSVDRRTREISELTTIDAMNIAAILMPAGRSAMFTMVV